MAEERMLITGGQRLEGTVRVSGGKNTSVAVISASILSETPCVIENLPNIEDVNVSVETLRHLGAKVNWDPDAGVMEVDSSTIDRTDVPLELCRRMRASSYYIGALLARFGRAQVPLPGGCDIGRRPIDQHIKGMRALGAKVETTRGLVVAQTDPGLKGDTATGATKPATLESGATVYVPLFINEGDTVRVDTETGSYQTRVSAA